MLNVRIGCAGWSLPRAEPSRFAAAGSHLERYASRFDAVEINSSFHRPHRPATYARWSASVPPAFRFSVKLPKTITHALRLQEAGEPLAAFLSEVAGLGEKLGCLLVQLPPSLSLDPPMATVAGDFFAGLRALTTAPVACEPRHPTWFTPEADDLLRELEVARVAADPARVAAAAEPGGWPGLSLLSPAWLPANLLFGLSALCLAARAPRGSRRRVEHPAWCIFDNTTLGAATGNALDLRRRLGGETL